MTTCTCIIKDIKYATCYCLSNRYSHGRVYKDFNFLSHTRDLAMGEQKGTAAPGAARRGRQNTISNKEIN